MKLVWTQRFLSDRGEICWEARGGTEYLAVIVERKGEFFKARPFSITVWASKDGRPPDLLESLVFQAESELFVSAQRRAENFIGREMRDVK